jgi:glycosyltransferase involved in cell wall biosynthesis
MIIDHLGSGGAQTLLIDLVRGLNRDRFEPLVCSLRCSKAHGVSLDHTEVKLVQLRGGRFNPLKVFQLIQLVRQGRIDVVHTHLTASRILGTIAGKLGGAKRILCHDHSSDEYLQKYPSVARFVLYPLDRLLMRFTDKVFAVSEATTKFNVEVKKIPKQKVELLHNWIDVERFSGTHGRGHRLRERWNIPREACVIGSVGRLGAQKDYRSLMRAAPHILCKHPQTYFVIVGEGDEREALERLTDELQIREAIRLPGFMSEVEQAYSAFDIFTLPSIYEPFGLVILEAMASGCPVIATRVGGIPEIIRDEVDGILVPPQNPELLARAINRLIADDRLRTRLAEAGKESVHAGFAKSRAIRRLEEEYEKAVPLIK